MSIIASARSFQDSLFSLDCYISALGKLFYLSFLACTRKSSRIKHQRCMLFQSVQAENLKGSFRVFLVSPFWFFKLIIMKFGKIVRLLKGKEKESKNLYFCFFFLNSILDANCGTFGLDLLQYSILVVQVMGLFLYLEICLQFLQCMWVLFWVIVEILPGKFLLFDLRSHSSNIFWYQNEGF